MKLYTEGIDPRIINGIKIGKPVKCRVWDDDGTDGYEDYVIFVYKDSAGAVHYIALDSVGLAGDWEYAEPILQKVKSDSEILRWLFDNDAEWDSGAEGFYSTRPGVPVFSIYMFEYCGKEPAPAFDWHPDWLEDCL